MTTAETTATTEPADGSIDAGLMLLLAVTPPGFEWTQQDIATACGCTKGYIWLVEKEAMRKLRERAPQLAEILRRKGFNDYV